MHPDSGVRRWRVKAKHEVTSISGFDLDGDGEPELISGWSSGKFEVCGHVRRARAGSGWLDRDCYVLDPCTCMSASIFVYMHMHMYMWTSVVHVDICGTCGRDVVAQSTGGRKRPGHLDPWRQPLRACRGSGGQVQSTGRHGTGTKYGQAWGQVSCDRR